MLSTPPRLTASSGSFSAFRKRRGRRRSLGQLERQHRAGAARPGAQWTRGPGGREPRVVHARTPGRPAQPLGDAPARPLLRVQPHGERLASRAARSQESCGPRIAPKAFWMAFSAPAQLSVARHGQAGDQVAVAAEELGGAVHDDVEAELERPLQRRAS